jgi:hypothetical protein
MKYMVSDIGFPTKAALQEYVKGILNNTAGEVDTIHLPFLTDLFERHQDALQKIGMGIATVRVRLAMPYKTRCFEIERVDGSRTDISYLECLKPSTAKQWFPAACRTAVADQIQEHKDAAFGAADSIPCAITGEMVTRETCHVDHAPPWAFTEIVAAFIRANWHIDINKVAYTDGDNVVESSFAEPKTAAEFAQFHKERAVLRVVSKRANLSILRRMR